MNKDISFKSWVIIIIMTVISIVSFRVSGNNIIFTGLLLSCLGIFFIGLLSNRVIGAIFGALIMCAGILTRNYFLLIPKLKGAKLDAFMQKSNEFQAVLSKYYILFIIGAALLGFVAGIIGEIIQRDKSNKFTTVKITYMAIFVALGAIVNSLRIGVFSFGGFPIILSGFILGPIPGFIVGGVTDVVAFIIRPSAFPFNPLFSLTSALTGMIPVVVASLLGDKHPKYTFIKILVGIAVGQILTSVVLAPLFSVWLYGKNTISVLMSKALIKQAYSIPLYAILMRTIIERIAKVTNIQKELA
ncbi:folate family ECF transporter S component [Helcococcus kunzii]|uniref:ECF transporter S component n=1 Tax=Helcococcus kunzii ATCC 51366 TaxID=883114 RepID=H3NMP5_9FIRM|nr:folate family ECF transporter S component [Helcococcus kunzii]EHR34733.1 hypothetical protein HMPREF9709_00606 [Helcococcus kunzii ATCC 51366]QUY64549.1 folate family ECF transporter S component [Helcococcus kunzii]QZO76962.1 folate family ECF transporter S component [Helcococcus kunzii]